MGFLKKLAPILPVIGAAAGGLLGGAPGAMAGGMAGGALSSAQGQADANAQNLQVAREQMKFQADMSNSAHQREVKDLQLAGLNPVLSAGGGGASAPSGASAQMQNEAPDFSQVISSGYQVKGMEQQIETGEQQLKLLREQTKKASSEASIAANNERLNDYESQVLTGIYNTYNQIPKSAEDYFKKKIQSDISDYQTNMSSNATSVKQNKLTEKHLEYDQTVAPLDAVLKRITPLINGASGAQRIINSMPKKQNPDHIKVNKRTGEIVP